MPDVSSARAERLVNLVLCLLSTRQFLPAERIRAIVPGYADAPSDEAFFRMFERDKTELRELGVPLETGRNSGFDTIDGYRIARHDYELGEIDLEPDEAAAVALAARLWESPELAGAAHGALVKLRAAGVEVDETGRAVQPRVGAAEPAFGPLLAAVQAGQAVTFAHRRGGPTGEVTPADRGAVGVVSWRGAAGTWSGHDRDRVDASLLPAVPDRRAGDDARRAGGGAGAARGGPARGGRPRRRPAPVIGTARLWVADGPRARPAPAGTAAPAAPARDRRTATSWRSTCAAWTRSPGGSPGTGRTSSCCARRSSRPRSAGRWATAAAGPDLRSRIRSGPALAPAGRRSPG